MGILAAWSVGAAASGLDAYCWVDGLAYRIVALLICSGATGVEARMLGGGLQAQGSRQLGIRPNIIMFMLFALLADTALLIIMSAKGAQKTNGSNLTSLL